MKTKGTTINREKRTTHTTMGTKVRLTAAQMRLIQTLDAIYLATCERMKV